MISNWKNRKEKILTYFSLICFFPLDFKAYGREYLPLSPPKNLSSITTIKGWRFPHNPWQQLHSLIIRNIEKVASLFERTKVICRIYPKKKIPLLFNFILVVLPGKTLSKWVTSVFPAGNLMIIPPQLRRSPFAPTPIQPHHTCPCSLSKSMRANILDCFHLLMDA